MSLSKQHEKLYREPNRGQKPLPARPVGQVFDTSRQWCRHTQTSKFLSKCTQVNCSLFGQRTSFNKRVEIPVCRQAGATTHTLERCGTIDRRSTKPLCFAKQNPAALIGAPTQRATPNRNGNRHMALRQRPPENSTTTHNSGHMQFGTATTVFPVLCIFDTTTKNTRPQCAWPFRLAAMRKELLEINRIA